MKRKKLNNFIAIGAIATLLVVGIIFLILNYIQNKGGDISKQVYEKVEAWSIGKSTSYGSIWVEDNKIKTDIKETTLQDYINSHKNDWETKEQEYPIGGMSPEGYLWDGIVTVSIGDDEFLRRSVLLELEDEFKNKYDFQLVKK